MDCLNKKLKHTMKVLAYILFLALTIECMELDGGPESNQRFQTLMAQTQNPPKNSPPNLSSGLVSKPIVQSRIAPTQRAPVQVIGSSTGSVSKPIVHMQTAPTQNAPMKLLRPSEFENTNIIVQNKPADCKKMCLIGATTQEVQLQTRNVQHIFRAKRAVNAAPSGTKFTQSECFNMCLNGKTLALALVVEKNVSV
jgi:hypothetical protein